jgi:hypothetical protein
LPAKQVAEKHPVRYCANHTKHDPDPVLLEEDHLFSVVSFWTVEVTLLPFPFGAGIICEIMHFLIIVSYFFFESL